MAAVFTVVWLVVGAGFAGCLWLYVACWRDGAGVVNVFLLPVAIFAVLLAYLATKLVYEEIIPCVGVDERYCAFSSTQYRNLFGWEF